MPPSGSVSLASTSIAVAPRSLVTVATSLCAVGGALEARAAGRRRGVAVDHHGLGDVVGDHELRPAVAGEVAHGHRHPRRGGRVLVAELRQVLTAVEAARSRRRGGPSRARSRPAATTSLQPSPSTSAIATASRPAVEGSGVATCSRPRRAPHEEVDRRDPIAQAVHVLADEHVAIAVIVEVADRGRLEAAGHGRAGLRPKSAAARARSRRPPACRRPRSSRSRRAARPRRSR